MTWGRAFRIGFVAAACLSFLVNAAVIGIGLRLANNGLLGGGFGMMLTDLPREKREHYADALRAERPQLRPLIEALQVRRQEMLAIAARDDVDSQALAEAMDAVRQATTDLQSAAHGVILTASEGQQPDPQ
ncbi:MAG: periplasmic heavy metal sensor [Pseudomonadota bacterium]